MHELSVAEGIVEQITDRLPGATIAVVRLRIGELSGVIPSAVEFCFDLAAEGTPVAGARLEIEEVAARCRCADCHRDFRPTDAMILCDCGSANVAVVAGGELHIGSVEVIEHV